jgi:hypothetical protein
MHLTHLKLQLSSLLHAKLTNTLRLLSKHRATLSMLTAILLPPSWPQITITEGVSGETVRQFTVKADPYEICVAARKEDMHKQQVRWLCTCSLDGPASSQDV